MKKIILIATLVCWTVGMAAQNPKGCLSIKPMAGVNISTFANGTEGMYHTKVGFTGGVEMEYGVNDWLGLSLGMLYSEQGAKVDGTIQLLYMYDQDQVEKYITASQLEGKLKCNYLNLPLMANIYIPVVKGLALKAGVQMGILTSDKMAVEAMTVIAKVPSQGNNNQFRYVDSSNPDTQVMNQKVSVSDVCKSIDLGIPVGLSYEYKNISLDARYYFGLTKIDKTENPDNAQNRYLSITLGYRFHL